MTFTNEEWKQEKEDIVYNRQDFWATNSNKQLNFYSISTRSWNETDALPLSYLIMYYLKEVQAKPSVKACLKQQICIQY